MLAVKPEFPARTLKDLVQLARENPGKFSYSTAGNGSMLAFAAPTRTAVDDFHRQALAHGGSDEGKPGLRPYGENFYACYVRDPDGNKLSAVCQGPA